MRKMLYALILAALYFAPVERLDVADLEPVRAVAVYKENGRVVLETDTEDRGEGMSAEEALQALKKNTPSVIYLDTAEFLLISENAEDQVDMLRKHLRSTVKVASYNGGPVKEEAEYADIHKEILKLRDWCPE